MLWLTDSSQNKISAKQYHVIISQAQVSAHRGRLFFLMLTAKQVLVFSWIAGSNREVVRAKATFRRRLTSGAVLAFLPTNSLNSRLLESP